MKTSLYIALIMLYVAPGSIADPKGTLTPTPTPCGHVLEAARNVIQAQDESIQRLRAYSKQLEDKVTKDEEAPLVPTWLWVVSGVVVGGVTGYILHK